MKATFTKLTREKSTEKTDLILGIEVQVGYLRVKWRNYAMKSSIKEIVDNHHDTTLREAEVVHRILYNMT